jgi:hypothetical protein
MRDLVCLWRAEWLARRITKREVMETFRTSNPLTRLLTRQIEELTEEVVGAQ